MFLLFKQYDIYIDALCFIYLCITLINYYT